jgi:hypothetical protein
MNVTVKYLLSPKGQKESILAGGSGKREQEMVVAKDDPRVEYADHFTALLDLAEISSDGTAVVNRCRYQSKEWDKAPAPSEFLAEEARARQEKKRAEEERLGKIKEDTLAVLRERKTRKHCDSGAITEDGIRGESVVKYETPYWPYEKDKTVIDSPEAQAWIEELHQAEVKARMQAEIEARADLAVKKEARAKAELEAGERAAKLAAWRKEHDIEDGDLLLRIEDGALANVPSGLWESHKRGKNWLAVITPSPSSPGGLSRNFAAKARGDLYYIVPDWSVGDAVEFGADYYSGKGRKNDKRWYGFVVGFFASKTETPAGKPAGTKYVILREFDSGKEAHREGQKHLTSLAK